MPLAWPARAAEGKGAEGRRAEPPGATRSPQGEHGEDGEHGACHFRAASTLAPSPHGHGPEGPANRLTRR